MPEPFEAAPIPELQPVPVIPEFFPKRATLLLAIAPNQLDLESKRSIADTQSLHQKPEFHLTVIGTDTGRQILAQLSQLSEADRNQALNSLRSFSEKTAWSVFLLPEFFLIQKKYPSEEQGATQQSPEQEIRTSIIQSAEVPALSAFYATLNRVFDQRFPVPYPHVTLFTGSTNPKNVNRGIGIYSLEDLKKIQPQRI